jgi:hypothetical protein
MAKLISIIAILLVALPALIAASACSVSVSSKLTESQSRYNVYEATITNGGSAAAANVALSSSVNLRGVSGLKESDHGYALSKSQVNKGGIAAGASYTFTYTVSKGKNVLWTASCTDGASSNPEKAATTAPTSKAATSKATTASASNPATTAPTAKAATTAPTSKTATTAPATGTNGRLCPAGTVWAPAPQTTWQWQIDGTVDTSFDVQMYDIDLFGNTAATIATLHSKGRAVICYFSTQYEDWRSDASLFTSAVIGKNLDDWAGEKYVDIRSPVVRNIMTARLDIAVSKGCDGVEPDNVDGYQASSGFPLTANDQLDFNRFIAAQAHARGLSVGLKNDLDQAAALQPSFDWALNEQCKQYGECGTLSTFINAGKAVFNAEYSGSGSSVCPSMVSSKISSIIKNLDLDAPIKSQCCTFQSNGCAAVPHTCKAVTSIRDVRDIEGAEQAVEAVEITTQEVPAAQNSATSSFASIAFVAVAAVAAMNL